VTSGGNNLNDFPKIQVTKFRAVNKQPEVCRQLFTQDSLREQLKSQILGVCRFSFPLWMTP